jgi:glutathione S-transferase
MMTLRSSPASPFGRKVTIAASILGLQADLMVAVADTTDPADSLRQQNPLGKLPVLIIEDGTILYDSPVILEYLDRRAGGGRVLPADGAARLAALRLQALGDGILDAAVLRVYEARWRPPQHQEPRWLDHQAGKMVRAMAVLEAEPPGLDATPHVGQITTACVLGYLDLRFGGEWRMDHPRLVAWLEAFAAAVPAFAETRVAA